MSPTYEAEKARYQEYTSTAATGRQGKQEEVRTSPLFSLAVKHTPTDIKNEDLPKRTNQRTIKIEMADEQRSLVLPQYALLGHHVGEDNTIGDNEPILLNVNAPSSAFICGSQGSGKSYTLASMLENVLLPTDILGKVSQPVAGVVFHYAVDSASSIAEATYLCSRGIKVNVVVSPSNAAALTGAYRSIDKAGKLTVKPLLLHSSDLSIERMHKLMAIAEKEGPMPLYMEVVQRILREMAMKNTFSYYNFKAKLTQEKLTKDQTGPMNLRLGLLESFMAPQDTCALRNQTHATRKKKTLFDLSPGSLTIIDLSDTFIDSSTVCTLFDICLGIIKEQRPPSGLALCIDEAHKYMNKSAAADAFTERLLTTIREQRHNAARVIIATQEPTISERLLDLCSISIVHRFTSPAWFIAIKDHLSGASKLVTSAEEQHAMFERIVDLDVGESLVFSPSSFVGRENGQVRKLGAVAMKMMSRKRLGEDGGMSVLASR
ncbi:hypothetical protein DOTSEDRAFT_164177 [Dothistroma septosporum NZE10]|uniref:AAA+ ATPase domain-containing protein n=1 Tax=Dothistroma septosporum (strain NZE10 / CBS 128990) TaxID=675120 RepID=N1Q1S8_DOTSN|nr:hypothetical protein DOTSEDRAFT_164177 [Dothistroma septosporum NZE10]